MRPSRASHYNRNPDNLPSRRYQKDTFLSGLAYDFSRLATRRLYGRFNFRRLPHLVIYAGTLGNLGESQGHFSPRNLSTAHLIRRSAKSVGVSTASLSAANSERESGQAFV